LRADYGVDKISGIHGTRVCNESTLLWGGLRMQDQRRVDDGSETFRDAET